MKNAFMTTAMLLCLTSGVLLLSSMEGGGVIYKPTAVFSCNPDDFTLSLNYGGFFVLQGAYMTPTAGYAYNITPVIVDGRGIGQLTLRITPPDIANLPLNPTPLYVQVMFTTASPVNRLYVKVEKGFSAGANNIGCIQIGGAQ